MPITTPRHRFFFAGVVGAVVALSALAMPTAASAAEVCGPGTSPTAQTQPWQDFANSPNPYVTVEAAFPTFVPTIAAALSTVDADFTQAEFDALTATIGNANTTTGATTAAALSAYSDQLAALSAGLQAADPAHQATNEAIIQGWADAEQASPYGTALSINLTVYSTELFNYLIAVQDAITADTPRPTVPGSLTTALAAFGAGFVGLADFAQVTFYDGAAAQVVCSLPATGAGDPGPATIAGGLLLLLGAAITIVATRRRELAAA